MKATKSQTLKPLVPFWQDGCHAVNRRLRREVAKNQWGPPALGPMVFCSQIPANGDPEAFVGENETGTGPGGRYARDAVHQGENSPGFPEKTDKRQAHSGPGLESTEGGPPAAPGGLRSEHAGMTARNPVSRPEPVILRDLASFPTASCACHR